MGNLSDQRIGAVVLAAGMSVRMGQPKMILPWGNKTIIGQVVHILSEAKLHPIAVVTGKYRDLVIRNIPNYDFIEAYNPDYDNGEMLVSLQVGLKCITEDCTASLLVLGDQPQIELKTVITIINAYSDTGHQLIIPSYKRRRGHPWLIGAKYWPEIFSLKPPLTLNEFIKKYESDIKYVNLGTRSILLDIDTPEEYQSLKPEQ